MRYAFSVLTFPILDHQSDVGVVRVNRQAYAQATRVGIAAQKIKPVFSLRGAPEHVVAKVNDVGLIARQGA